MRPHRQPDWTTDDLGDIDPVLHRAMLWHELMRGTPDPQTRQDFLKWQQSAPSHAIAYQEISALWQGIGAIRTNQASKTRRNVLFGIGAVAVGLGTAAWWGTQPFADMRAPRGQLLARTLPEGSRVELAGNSTLSWHYTDIARAHRLHGTAWFDLRGGRAAVVSTGDATLRGNGGQVGIATGNGMGTATVLAGNFTLTFAGVTYPIGPAQEATFGQHGVTIGHASDTLSWRTGYLTYIDTPLPLIIAGVNRWSHREVLLIGSGFAGRRATLMLETARADEAAGQLADALGLRMMNAGFGPIAIMA